MATKTEIYEFRKKEENDFYNVEDFNNNMDMMETALTEFDDSGTAEGVTSFPDMLAKLVTGNKLAVTLKNLKAGLQFVLHAGSIVNNCVTDNPNLPLSAAQGKALQDLITVLNNEAKNLSSNIGKTKMIQSTSLSDFDSKVTMDGLHIVYGMIDNTGYISFDINWIRLQFKISLNKVQYRLRYGDSSFTAWTTFSA